MRLIINAKQLSLHGDINSSVLYILLCVCDTISMLGFNLTQPKHSSVPSDCKLKSILFRYFSCIFAVNTQRWLAARLLCYDFRTHSNCRCKFYMLMYSQSRSHAQANRVLCRAAEKDKRTAIICLPQLKLYLKEHFTA